MLIKRPRRLRKNQIIRNLIAETRLSKEMFVYPYFVTKGKNIIHPIDSMPGINHYSVDSLTKDVEKGLKAGINKILLFGVGDEKTDDGSSSYSENSIIPLAIKKLKSEFKDDLYIITDVCLCAYTTHGHCGIIEKNYVQNDATLIRLSNMALAHANAGADMVAPSDMMDGRVAAIRKTLDENEFFETAIMSYAVKFASAYYGPFREAAQSSPSFGDRKSYQMDYRNPNEAIKEAKLDEDEGADIIMVKPALAYLDIIYLVKKNTTLPVACYNVSAEYSLVKIAAKNAIIDEEKIVMENVFAFARAGASIIISYHTKDIFQNKWL